MDRNINTTVKKLNYVRFVTDRWGIFYCLTNYNSHWWEPILLCVTLLRQVLIK